jgi:6-phosphogluconolactonase
MIRQSCYLTAILAVFGGVACGSGAPASGAASTEGGAQSTAGQPSMTSGGVSVPATTGGSSAGTAAGGVVSGGGASTTVGGTSPASGGSSTTGGASTSGGAPSVTPSGKAVVFVGGFGADPVHLYDLDKSTGALVERLPSIDAGPEPSCLALDPSRTHLYVCNEDDTAQGGVTAFTLQANGAITKLNHQVGSDLGFTQVAVSPNGKFLAAAGYNGGSASVFSLGADGSVGAEADVMDFGANAETHYVAYDLTGKYLLVTTKGTSAVQQLKVDDSGKLSANAPPRIATASGAGPRHLAVHPNGKFAYVVTESGSTVIAYQLAATGTLTLIATVPSVPANYQGQNSGAHVELSPDGRFLYVSNRGHDSVGVFKVDASTGALTLVTHALTHSASPHDFDIDAEGRTLITANRKGNSLTVFKIETDGTLMQLGQPVPTRTEPTAVLIHNLK